MSFAINGKGYVGGGVNGNEGVDNEFWEYDPQLNSWSKKGNLPKYPYSFSTMTSFAIGQKGYLFTSGYTDDFWEYDPPTDTWTRKADFPGAGMMEQVGFAIGTKGYIGTGYGGGLMSTSEFWQYDTAQDRWSKKADFPGTPRMSAVGFSINNTGFIGLGVSNGGVFHNDFWEYHPETDSWNQIEDCGYFVADAVAMTIGSKGYVGTGLFDGSAFWEYAPDLSSISTIDQSPKVYIYPNPVREKLFLDINYPGSITFSIYSVLGQMVKTGATTERFISVVELPEGVYVLKILSPKLFSCKEFVKE
jgi:N-acetylneuraminic acid mutarotase